MRKTINLSGGIVNRGNPWAVGQLPSGPSSDRSTRRCAGISTNTGRHVQELENLPLVRRSDWDNQPIVCHFIPMLFCESDQVGVCRIAFVSNMCRKEAAVGAQHTFRAHSVFVLNDLTRAQMVSAKLFGTKSVIQDHNIELHLVLPERLPQPFVQPG